MANFKKMKINELYDLWKNFKNIRHHHPVGFSDEYEGFLTVIEREALIDELFKRFNAIDFSLN